jgi:hypothetical protein
MQNSQIILTKISMHYQHKCSLVRRKPPSKESMLDASLERPRTQRRYHPSQLHCVIRDVVFAQDAPILTLVVMHKEHDGVEE